MQRRSALPARLASNNLPNKPMVELRGEAMIVAVWHCVMEADVAPVWAATDTPAIVDAVRAVGGNAVMTRQDHQPFCTGGWAPGRRAAGPTAGRRRLSQRALAVLRAANLLG